MSPWRCIAEQLVEYEEAVDAKAYFDKIICLWKEYPNAISNRINTSVPVEEESQVWNEVIANFESKYRFDPANSSELSIFKLIQKDFKKQSFSNNCYEVAFYEEELLVRFYPIVLDGQQHPHFESPYSIACKIPSSSSILLQFFKPVDAPDDHFEFLKTLAFKQLVTWLKSIDLSKTTRKTHALLDKESYISTYRHIREDLGRPLVEGWTENSKPQKVIFEDCGIASYIQELITSGILPKPRKFVDIGCGNGLLVHLLNKIEIPGYGVDVRSRKVWKTTLSHVDLRESPVDPQIVVENRPHFDADVDLLIGNHSDELTPWIPVMAAKLNCNFFLIPCCPYNFFGKYLNNGSHFGPKRMTSQYESFFEWTVSVAERLGFDTKMDRLAIPSTKRLCIIGRVPEKGLCPDLVQTIEHMTQGQKFVARPREIRNNNCMHISVTDRERIAKKLFDFILNYSDDVRDGWRCGGEVPLAQLAGQLTDDDKKLMKDQDGGLQTFLRNHHQIFHVFQATARLRDFRQPVISRRQQTNPKKQEATNRPKQPCWMSLNHPDGCPLGPESCRYLH
ncbi:hypothetical protein B9Z55_009109 [Caenorhabditis nigoni]|uniref:tRNA (uracil-O(2)-)-methyltransferase n=1 Tax=Caenorhabditis nigoni TaxID=1611254 RepID=A0A2G5UR20_9PELO|nr:hypothetical protein B9Z55_009109 [Caenorhabditis nigoni]